MFAARVGGKATVAKGMKRNYSALNAREQEAWIEARCAQQHRGIDQAAVQPGAVPSRLGSGIFSREGLYHS